MQLPNASAATLDIRKVSEYCLSETHALGRHKARVFKSAPGITSADAEWLRGEILDGVRTAVADQLDADRFGTRYGVNIAVRRQEKAAVVRTIWILPRSAEAPRFVTCWVV